MAVYYHEGKFPPESLDWQRIIGPLADATEAIARYDSFLGIIPDADILIAPLMTQEAVTSSRIEGTKATVGDVLAYEAGSSELDPARRNDIMEVINYQQAVTVAEEMLGDVPLSGRVLRSAHRVLLSGVRGQYKSPGKYRIEQNWIGRTYDISEARYVPPAPEKVEDAMAEWERFVNDGTMPALVRVSIAHAEFESIHPFLDGNGRIGRMIIPLMLCQERLMSHPCFYLSEFFEHRNSEYQDRLLAVSRDGAWTEWCEFFLGAMAHQARENHEKAEMIYSLFERTRARLIELTSSAYSDKVVTALFRAAIFQTTRVIKDSSVNPKTARRLLAALKEDGLLIELEPASGSKPAIYLFPELFRISEGIDRRTGESIKLD